MTLTGFLSPEEIESISIYAKLKPNTISGMRSILKETGGDIVLNGTIFVKMYKACTHLKVNNKVYLSPNYTAWAISWNTPNDFGVKVAPNKDANYMQCVKAIINGAPIKKMDYQPDMYYATHRTAMGTSHGKIAYFATQDKLHPEQLRNKLFQAGWDNAIMLDGGGSTAILTSDGQGFAGDGRLIPFWIVIKKKKSDHFEPKGGKPMKVEINAYSLKHEGNLKLSSHFLTKEFACRDGSDAILVAPRLVMILETIRTHFNAPVRINSAYRTPQYNKKIGGATYSQHCYGTAADISVTGKTPKQVAEFARSLMPDYGGVGVYGTFTHIDVRDTKTDWKG